MTKIVNILKRVTFNSPVILTYVIFCGVVLALNTLTGGFTNRMFFVCYGHPSLYEPLTYLRFLTHIFGHSSFSHYINNMMYILLLGPIVEEHFGSWNLCVMMFIAGVGTGILNGLLFSKGIIGASGIVFMLIILSAFTYMKNGKIPLTLLLVTAAYLGQEIYDGIVLDDNISHFAHLTGGVFGIVFGIMYYRKKENDKLPYDRYR